VAVGRDAAARSGDDAADDVDERGLAGAIGSEQGKDLAFLDVEIDLLEGLEAAGVGLGDVVDRDD